MRSSRRVLGFFPLLVVGCASVSTEPPPAATRAPAPVFESLAVNGPVYRDFRVAGYDTSSDNTVATVNASNGQQNYSATGTSTTTHTVERVEAFDNQSLRNRFIRQLEEAHVADRLTPSGKQRLDASINIEGATSAGKIVWNVFDSVTGLCILAIPYFGSSLVTVEVRAYDDDRYLRSYTAEARADWRVSGLWGVIYTVPEAKSEAMSEAGDVALAKVIGQIIADPPARPDGKAH